jgi:peptidyl-prolyl cis-trans isomerase SurA
MQKKMFAILLVSLLSPVLIFAQNKGGSALGTASPTVIRSSKEAITLDEFEAAYRRMNDKDPYRSSFDSLKEFLNLYSDYRLKLLEAKEMGLDADKKITIEIDGYKKMLAGPFLLDKELTEPAVRRMYERRQIEVSARHYLASIKNPNNSEDTLKAYKRALEAIKRMDNGTDISILAMGEEYFNYLIDAKAAIDKNRSKNPNASPDTTVWPPSDDNSTAKDGGNLGYFTAGMTVRSFEDAVYGLNVGEYTKQPVRTRYGYHVIQLTDKQKRVGGVKVHHILISMPKELKGPDTMKYFLKADSIRKVLLSGGDFEKIAKESSEDRFTASKGGDMGYINREDRRAEKSFDAAAYSLKDGELSDIVRTSFGYHIIRRNGSIPTKSFDEEKDQLKKIYKNYFFNDDKARKLAEYRSSYGAKVDTSTFNIFMSRVDSSRTSLDSNWAEKFTLGEKALVLFEINKSKHTISSFIDSLKAQPGYPLARNSLADLISKMLDEAALQLASSNIDAKYPEFGKIMEDYKNGIMLFELENQKVWSKVKSDSVLEREFYQEHKARYMWPERVDVSEIYIFSDSLASALYKRIVDGEDFDSLAREHTERPGFKTKAGKWGLLQKDENDIAKKVFTFPVDDIKPPFEFQAGYSIVRINKRIPITQKTFEEARQEVASQYQDDLSSELRLKWVQELRTKYKRELNVTALETEWKKRKAESGVQ